MLGCGEELLFYYDDNGNYAYELLGTALDDRVDRTLLEEWEDEAEAEADADADAAQKDVRVVSEEYLDRDGTTSTSFSSLGEGVEDVTSSSLRGSKGSKTIT
jgi:hypothetical protein